MNRIPLDVFCYVLRPKLTASAVIAFEQSTLYHRFLVHSTRQKRASRFGYINELVYLGIREKIHPYYKLKLMLSDVKSTIKFSDIKLFWNVSCDNELASNGSRLRTLHDLTNEPIVPYTLIKCALSNTEPIKYLYAPRTIFMHSVFYISGRRGSGTGRTAKWLVSTFTDRIIFICSQFFDGHRFNGWRGSLPHVRDRIFSLSIGSLFDMLKENKVDTPTVVVFPDGVMNYIVEKADEEKIVQIFSMLRKVGAIIVVISQLKPKYAKPFLTAIGRCNALPYVNLRNITLVEKDGDEMLLNNCWATRYSECNQVHL